MLQFVEDALTERLAPWQVAEVCDSLDLEAPAGIEEYFMYRREDEKPPSRRQRR